MLCLMARRYLAADNGRPTDGDTAMQRALVRHLASCPGCRSEQERLGHLLTLLASAAPPLQLGGDQFSVRLMATIQARQKAERLSPEPFAWTGFRPAAVLPALCLMLVAGFMALYLSGQAIPGTRTQLATSSVTQVTYVDDYQDSLKLPREIPFSVEEDLVGTRRGTIPLTTYVLEPAPTEAPIVLASF